MSRLDHIATRQRSSRARDVVFCVCVALATIIAVAGVATSGSATSTATSAPMAGR
jgi:hypothetical protein